jgi:hypothetical protein
VSCEFAGDHKNDMIRDQIVDACKSTELRRKFLAAQDLTLEKVHKIGRTYELAVMCSEKIEQPKGGDSENETISKLRKINRQQFKPKGAPKSVAQKKNPPNTAARFSRETALCYRCGQAGHYGRNCRISRDIVCRKCGRTGHFAKMCIDEPESIRMFTTLPSISIVICALSFRVRVNILPRYYSPLLA